MSSITLALGFLLVTPVGCSASGKWIQGTPQAGVIQVSRAPAFPSYCFDGLVRRWHEAGCETVQYQKVDEGFIKYWCDEWDTKKGMAVAAPAKESQAIAAELHSNDYFLILWNSNQDSYARPAPEDTTYICGDSSALLITAERD